MWQIQKVPNNIKRTSGVCDYQERRILWKERSVVLERTEDQELTAESLTTQTTGDLNAGVAEIGDLERIGENLLKHDESVIR